MKTIADKGMKVALMMVAVLASQAHATDIGAPSGGFFANIGAWMQDLVSFLEGPWGLFVPIVGLSIAIAVWMFSTRGNEQLGWVGRVVIGSLLIVNIPTTVIAIQAF